MFFNKMARQILMGLFFFIPHLIFSQDQRVADSLIPVYEDGNFNDSIKLEILREIAFNQIEDFKLKLEYSQILIEEAEKSANSFYLYHGYLQTGNSYFLTGNLEQALSAFFTSAELGDDLGFSKEGAAYMSIADVYSVREDFHNANIYYQKAIEALRKDKDSIVLGAVLLNAGDSSFKANEYDQALIYFEESGLIFRELDYSIGIAYNLGNKGMVYAELGKDDLAEENIEEAIAILSQIQDYYPISVFLSYMSDIYLRKDDFDQALSFAQRSLELAEGHDLKEQIRDGNLKMFELKKREGKFDESITYLQNYYIYRDSMIDIETVEEMANLRANFEVSQKQAEVDLLDQQRKNQQLISLSIGIGLLLILILAVGLFRRNKFVNKAKLLIENEKDRSDQLLLNILPEETATELKDKGKVKAKRFESVSVMFTDFKGFTAYSDKLSPEELVDSIDFYYSRFDEIVEKHGLEKIKTVGDAYMCAGGLPDPDPENAHKMIAAAIEIAEFVKESKKNDPNDMTRFDIRIGINTGPVVAGVVGKKKFAYDIWGDTVNIASRMESNSEPGKINVSETTYKLIKDQYKCSYRGEIEAKNKGMMKMYFVEHATDEETN